MTTFHWTGFFGLILSVAASGSMAQGNSAALVPPAAQPDPCRAAVFKFEHAMGFIRQSQGNKIASELKEKLLPAKLESEILLKDGYCGLAKYLHEKKLDR